MKNILAFGWIVIVVTGLLWDRINEFRKLRAKAEEALIFGHR
jgi:hypothetical protein